MNTCTHTRTLPHTHAHKRLLPARLHYFSPLPHAAALTAFWKFLKQERSEENLDFWFAVQEYARCSSSSSTDDDGDKKAQEIFDKFIAAGADSEVGRWAPGARARVRFLSSLI